MLYLSALFGLLVAILQLGYAMSQATATVESVFRAAMVGAGATLALHRWFCWALRMRRPGPDGPGSVPPPATSS